MLRCEQWAAMQAKAKLVEGPAKPPRKPKGPAKPQKPVKIEVPAGFVCPVCEANKVKAREKMKRYRLRKRVQK